jgi:membrane protease YdiL (CAAX protease family)
VPPSTPTLRRSDGNRAPVPIRDAVWLWLAAWFIGQLLATAVAAASGFSDLNAAGPGWLFLVATAGWVPLVVVVVLLGRKYGTGDVARDFGLEFRWRDLLGIPIGVVTQLALLPALYWPLRRAWPGAFSQHKIEQRARDLTDHATGAGRVLLALVVVLGAPLVEELVYRGLLQGAFTRKWNEWAGVVMVAVWFAIVHFQPVETPGLFLVGLILGACALRTRRLGMNVFAHMAFNATGLLVVAFA